MQCPRACPGLATHTLAGLFAMWLPSGASSCGNLHKPAKPRPQQTTCPSLPQPPVQAPLLLLHTAEAAFDLAVPQACQGLANLTLARLCALWLPSAASSSETLHKQVKPQPPQTTCTALPQPPVPTPPHLLRPATPTFDLSVHHHGMPRAGPSHTGRAL